MDIQKEREAFEVLFPTYGCTYSADLDYWSGSKFLGEHRIVEVNASWKGWIKAKAQAVPEGFVLVEKSKIKTWYQDDDEPENFCNSESDLDCLGDCLDDDDIIAVNIHESAHISTKKVFGVWKSNSPTDIQSKFILVDLRVEAEQIVAANKAMIEAREQSDV